MKQFLVVGFGLLALITVSGFRERPSIASAKVPASKDLTDQPAKMATTLHKVGHPLFASPHVSPISISGDRVFVVNTPSDTVDVIDRQSREIVSRIHVGVDPVSIAVRPDGREVWVSNHISDSVSVISNDLASVTDLQVIATIQDFDAKTRSTRFDEPVGIAFAGNDKAYVALSSENQIAVIDVGSRAIKKRLRIPAQDPRSIIVRGDRLYVIPFESNNKTQLSGGAGDKIDGDLVTFDAWQHSVIHNNVLSIGHVVDIVKHPDVPDRDLFVFNTKTDELIETVDTLGTLLYGMTVDSNGSVFVAQTDARNHANGRAGTKKHGMEELKNRAFLNQITRVDFEGSTAQQPEFFDLEPTLPAQPDPGRALATPFAIQVSKDDSTLVVTAAGSDKLFTVDATSGEVLSRISVGAVPRGIALDQSDDEKLTSAWVYNAVANTVSVVDLSDIATPKVTGFVPLEDPTDRRVKLGRTWFNSATASTTGTYSCASCHPDGHTDQLLWVLKTPIVSGGNQIMPRSTMPIRGLRDTAPFHWDGIPGDPYGGNNSANVRGSVERNSDIDKPETSTRHLLDGGLASTMLLQGSKAINDEGKSGTFSAVQRDDMAKFLLSVPYPPAQKRAYTNVVSKRATDGFELFHIKGHHDEKPKPNVCGDCHRMPHLVSTNTPGSGMDAPTWRGAYDRFLILPQGRLNIVEFDFYRRIAEEGIPERKMWQFSWQGQRRFDPIWEMVLEGSTGYSGAFARQATISKTTAKDELTADLMNALEVSAREGAIVLEAEGVFIDDAKSRSVTVQFLDGKYVAKDAPVRRWTRRELIKLASLGKFVGTFTARHGADAEAVSQPQPALWTLGPLEKQSGHQNFPILFPGEQIMTISGRHIETNAHVIIDGRRTQGKVVATDKDRIEIRLTSLPKPGMHLLQVQNPGGQFSNDFIFNVVDSAEAAKELVAQRSYEDRDIRDAIAAAIAENDIHELRTHLNRRQQQGRIDEHQPRSGSTPLSNAAMHGHREIAEVLLRRGAKVNRTNRDGNTPLLIAAFFCHQDVVELLLEKGASPTKENKRGESPIDVVAGAWDDNLAGLYKAIGKAVGIELDLDRIQKDRSKIAVLLREKSKPKAEN
ncbi:ankyrin repeat domain-containing protein [bacterium]|nr:ankyrin repeat domain-containing protein [bacterium]